MFTKDLKNSVHVIRCYVTNVVETASLYTLRITNYVLLIHGGRKRGAAEEDIWA